MAKQLTLNGLNAELSLEEETDSWIRCYLNKSGQRLFLGAETKSYVVKRLVDYLENPTREINGKLDGTPVSWVLSLAENHHVLYCSKAENGFLLFWQNSSRENFGIAGVTETNESQINDWLKKLKDFHSDDRN